MLCFVTINSVLFNLLCLDHIKRCVYSIFFNTDPKYRLAILQPLYYTPHANYQPAYTLTIQRSFYHSQTKWKRILKWQKTCKQDQFPRAVRANHQPAADVHEQWTPKNPPLRHSDHLLQLITFIYILLSPLEQTYCALVACDSEWVTVTSYNMVWISTEMV